MIGLNQIINYDEISSIWRRLEKEVKTHSIYDLCDLGVLVYPDCSPVLMVTVSCSLFMRSLKSDYNLYERYSTQA
jgi:hypothetical protein